MRNLEKYKWVSGCCEQNVLPKLCLWWWNCLALRYTAWNRSFLKREYSVKQGGGWDRNFFSKGVEMNVLQHNGKKGGPPPSFFIPLFRPLIQSHSTHRLEEEEEEEERGGGGNRSHKSPLWKKRREGRKKAAYVEWIYGSVHCTRSVLMLLHIPPQKIFILRIFFLLHRSIGLRIVARKLYFSAPCIPPSLPQGEKEEVKK